MARNKVMKLWTAIVTAFVALCTALGLVTTTAAAAVPRTETTRNSDSTAELTVPAMSHWAWSYARSLPPTMKQRIRAEAHGKTPSCRHRALGDTEADADTEAADTEAEPAALDCASTEAEAPVEHTHLPLRR